MSREEKLAEFVGWAQHHITGDEKGQAQIFLDRLFQAFGHPGVLDVFDIEWSPKDGATKAGPYPMPALTVTVLGPAKELAELHITDDRLVPGTRQPIKDVEKLLAIKDDDFASYTEQQKADLLACFSAVPLPPPEGQAGQHK